MTLPLEDIDELADWWAEWDLPCAGRLLGATCSNPAAVRVNYTCSVCTLASSPLCIPCLRLAHHFVGSGNRVRHIRDGGQVVEILSVDPL